VREKILVVESDSAISDFVARQSLEAAGYQVIVTSDSSAALSKVVRESPDAVILNLDMPGLSGRDLLAALASQTSETPVVVIAKKGGEDNIITAFRLGAADYLIWPVREAEVVAVMERVLTQVRNRREREDLARKLQQANYQLQQRVRELTTIYGVGKMVTSITDQSLLFERILEGSMSVTQSDMGWLMLQDEVSREYRIAAQRNLPESMSEMIVQPWDDGLSSLVAMSGESLAVHGPSLRRFRISTLGEAVLIVPVKANKTVIGMLVMIRKEAKDYSASEQNLLEALADYASISLVNARLFHALEDRAESLQRLVENAQAGEKIHSDLLRTVKNELRGALQKTIDLENQIAKTPMARWTSHQREQINELNALTKRLSRVVESIQPEKKIASPLDTPVNFSEVVCDVAERYQNFAQINDQTVATEVPTKGLVVLGVREHFDQIVAGLLSNAIKFNMFAGKITVRLREVDKTAQLEITDMGCGITEDVFDTIRNNAISKSSGQAFGGLGIGLELIQELTKRHSGKLWFTSRPGEGSTIYIAFPIYLSQDSKIG